jgi:Fe-S oxidoreductase
VDVASERQSEAAETGAEALVTACPFCEMNLGDALARDGGLSVVDIVELVLESISGAPEEPEPAG